MNRLQRNLATGLGLLLFATGAAWAEETYELDIDDQELSSALKLFAEQSGLQVVYFADLANGKQSKGVHGTYSADEALADLLEDTDLAYSTVDDRTYAIAVKATAEDEGGDSELGNGRTAGATSKPVMMAQASAEQSQTSRRTETDNDEDERKRPLEEIIVTGTNIRGIAPESSPVRVFDREDIQISGAATAQDFIQTLPENFGGGAAEFGSSPGNQQAGSNVANGSSVNLRGLGSGSTLVLLNGRRVAPSSDIGGFVDISMIPASAIERVEVLTEGASSIYGADAVAGVTNFVLRDDYEGIETSLRYGTVTEGDMDEYRVSLTGGKNWSTGNGLIVYEYYNRDNLDSSDRAFSKDFLSPNDLLPRQDRHSVIGTVTQQLLPSLEFGGNILYSRRESFERGTLLTGSSVGLLSEFDINSENLNIGTNLNWNVSADWFIDIAGVYSETSSSFARFRSASLDLSSSNKANLWSIEGKASGTIFELPAGPAKVAVGGHFRQETFLRSSDTQGITRDGNRNVYAVFGEAFIPIVGQGNALPGVQRLELNVSGRYEDYSDFGSEVNPKVGLLWAPTDRLKFRGTYSTSFKPPTVGQTGALDRGANALPFSFILDVFDVETADPSIADSVMLVTFGTENNLDAETSRAFTGGVDYEIVSGRHDVSLSSTYFDIIFEGRLGSTPVPNNLSINLAPNIAFNSPASFPDGTIIFFPNAQELDDVLASLNLPVRELFGADPSETEIINNAAIVRNLSRTETRGIDFNAVYSFDADFGLLTLGIDATYLIDFTEQAVVTTPVVQLLDTQFNPLNLNLRGRIGYAQGGFNANLFVNYADNYKSDNTDAAANINSWTTVDLSLSYSTGIRYESPILDNVLLRLSVQNLFDENPPAAPSLPSIGLLGFDPTNASPLGRFIAFEIKRRF